MLRDGDLLRLDAARGVLEVCIPAEELAAREPASIDLAANAAGTGRELFGGMRAMVTGAEAGATTFGFGF